MSCGLMFLSTLLPTNLLVGNDDEVGAWETMGPKISLSERSEEESSVLEAVPVPVPVESDVLETGTGEGVLCEDDESPLDWSITGGFSELSWSESVTTPSIRSPAVLSTLACCGSLSLPCIYVQIK